MPTYQPNIPTGTVPFNQDYLNVQGNFQVADTSFGTDHYAFSDATSNNGYHKVIHSVANSVPTGGNPNNFPITPPATVPLTGEVFSTQTNVGLGADSILWWQTAAGKLAQMTVNFNPTASFSGATFLPGGIIMNWGGGVVGTGTTAYVFTQAYQKNTPFSIVITGQTNSSPTNGIFVDQSSITKLGFSVKNFSSSITAVNWIVLGN